MKGESKICISDAVPLNASGVTKVYLNTGNGTKSRSFEGPQIHLQKESNSSTTDIDLHLNTTLSIKSSKKIRVLFMVNFLLSSLCFLIVGVIAFYYWKEMMAVRHDVDLVKDRMMRPNAEGMAAGRQIPLAGEPPVPSGHLGFDLGHRNEVSGAKIAISASNRITREESPTPVQPGYTPANVPQESPNNKFNSSAPFKDMFVVQFNGAIDELHLGDGFNIGPWVVDKEVSSENSSTKIALTEDSKCMTVKESGLYLVYAQVVYLSFKPNCYFVWARAPAEPPRLVSTCCTGDDGSRRAAARAQMSCSAQSVARLRAGDTILLSQREANAILWLRPGYSYIGFVKLNS